MKDITKPDKAWFQELKREDATRVSIQAETSYRRAYREFNPPRDLRPLEDRVSEAIAWGTPDHESAGMSQASLVSLLSELNRAYKQAKPK